jgi:hypothetical protein
MNSYNKLEVRVLGDPADLIRSSKGIGHDGGDPDVPLAPLAPFGDPEE